MMLTLLVGSFFSLAMAAASYFNPLDIPKKISSEIQLGPKALIKVIGDREYKLVKGAVQLSGGPIILRSREGGVRILDRAIVRLSDQLHIVSIRGRVELLEFDNLPVPEGYAVKISAKDNKISRPMPVRPLELKELQKELGLHTTQLDLQMMKEAKRLDVQVQRQMASDRESEKQKKIRSERAKVQHHKSIRRKFRKKAGLDL